MKSKGKLSRWSRTPMERRRSLWGWGFISLWFIGTVAFFVVPMLQTAVYAFSKVTLTSSGVNYQYVGLKNFLYVFTEDADFLPNLTESLGTMLYRVPIIVIFSLLMAMLLRNKFRGKTFFRSVFFFPVIIASGVVITILQTQVMMTGSATTAGQESYMFSAPDFLVLTETLGVPQGIANSPPAFSSGASTCGRSESRVSAPISRRKSSRSPLSRRGMNDSFGSVKA